MKPALPLALLLSLAACSSVSESKLNPVNWFGGSDTPEISATVDPDAIPGGRALIDQVTKVELDPTTGGVIVTATGLPPTQGYWDATLIPGTADQNADPSVLTLRFVVAPPNVQSPTSTTQSREMTAAQFVSRQTLSGVRRIVVVGARSSASASIR